MSSWVVPLRRAVLALGVIAAITPGVTPQAQTPYTVIVTNSDEGSMSIVDRQSMTEIRRIPVGREPHHAILTPDGKDLIIASTVTNELQFVDPVTGQERRRVRNIIDPYQIGFSPDGQWFVTAAYRVNHVDVYDAKDLRLVKRLPLFSLPSHLTFSADSAFASSPSKGRTRSPRSTWLQKKSSGASMSENPRPGSMCFPIRSACWSG